MPSEFEQNVKRLEEAIGEAKETVRDLHAARKDAVHEIKEALTFVHDRAEKIVQEQLSQIVVHELRSIQDQTADLIEKMHVKIEQRWSQVQLAMAESNEAAEFVAKHAEELRVAMDARYERAKEAVVLANGAGMGIVRLAKEMGIELPEELEAEL